MDINGNDFGFHWRRWLLGVTESTISDMKNLRELRIFVKFLLVGALNTAVGVSLYFFFLFVGASPSISLLLSTILGVLFNFKTIGILVFKNRNNKLLFRFFLCYGLMYLLNIVFMNSISYYFAFNDYITGGIVLPITAVMSFFIQKTYVFKKN